LPEDLAESAVLDPYLIHGSKIGHRREPECAERFGFKEVPDLEPHYNIAPTQLAVMIRLDLAALQTRSVQIKCGLMPFLTEDASIGYRPINDRAESVAKESDFPSALK
jgi:putative SOS response-associated peptidase YedK